MARHRRECLEGWLMCGTIAPLTQLPVKAGSPWHPGATPCFCKGARFSEIVA